MFTFKRTVMVIALIAVLVLVNVPGFAETKVSLGCKYISGIEGDVTWADYVFKNTTKETIPKGATIEYTTDNIKAHPATLKTTQAEKPGALFGPPNTNSVLPGKTCKAWRLKP